MPFKDADRILRPDARFADLYIVRDGEARKMGLANHHAAIVSIQLNGSTPSEVRDALDRPMVS